MNRQHHSGLLGWLLPMGKVQSLMPHYCSGLCCNCDRSKTTWKPHLTDGIVVGRVPGVDDGGVHEPDVPLRHLPQLVELLGGAPLQHAHHVPKVIGRVRVLCSTATTKTFDPSAFSDFFSTHTAKKIRPMYSQKWNCSALFPIPTFIYLWAIYMFPRFCYKT